MEKSLAILLLAFALVLGGCADDEEKVRTEYVEIEVTTGACESLDVAYLVWADGKTRETEVLLCTLVTGQDCIVYKDNLIQTLEHHCELDEWY